MKKILVPIDFSDISYKAASTAATLAKKTGGEITFLHVFEDSENPEAKSKLEAIQQEEYLKDIKTHIDIKSGDPIEEITSTDATIIIMAGRELKGIKGFFSHTTAEKVAKAATCPVITVKRHTDLSKIKSIVYPTDMRAEQTNMIAELKELRDLYDAHLHLVKVFEDDFVLKKDLEKRLKDYAEFNKLKSYSVTALEGMDEAEHIMRFADSINADIIAMATHDRKGLERLIGGYISGEILKEASTAIWTKTVD